MAERNRDVLINVTVYHAFVSNVDVSEAFNGFSSLYFNTGYTVMKIFKNVLKRECVKPVVSHDDPSMDQKSSLLD